MASGHLAATSGAERTAAVRKLPRRRTAAAHIGVGHEVDHGVDRGAGRTEAGPAAARSSVAVLAAGHRGGLADRKLGAGLAWEDRSSARAGAVGCQERYTEECTAGRESTGRKGGVEAGPGFGRTRGCLGNWEQWLAVPAAWGVGTMGAELGRSSSFGRCSSSRSCSGPV